MSEKDGFSTLPPSENSGLKKDQPYMLPNIVTIETVEALFTELLQPHLLQSSTFTVDASRVESITTPGVQLLDAFQKTFASYGGSFVIEQPSSQFEQSLKNIGLKELLTK